MLKAFFDAFWYPLSIFLYHLVAIPCMAMFPFRFSPKRRKYCILGGTLLSCLLFWLLRLLCRLLVSHGLPWSYFCSQLLYIIPMLLVCCVLYKGNPYSMLLSLLLSMTLAATIGRVYGDLMLMLWKPTFTPEMLILRDILGYGSFALYFIILRQHTNVVSFYLSRRDHIILIFLALVNLYCSTCRFAGNIQSLNGHLLFMIVCTFATLAITFLLFRFTKSHQQAIEQQLLIRDMKASEGSLLQIQEATAQMREFKHELSNYLIYAEQLLQNQDYEALEHYLHDLSCHGIQSVNTISTGNSVVDSILNQKSAYAKSLGIETQLQVSLPEKLSLDDLTLCSLFGNLMNNAIEACIGQPSPYIHLNVHPVKNYLALRIDNSVPEDILKRNPHLFSTKKDAENHGIGMRVLEKITREHNGILHYEMSGPNCFTMEIIVQQDCCPA